MNPYEDDRDPDPCLGDDACTCDDCTFPCALCGEPIRGDEPDVRLWGGPAVTPHVRAHQLRAETGRLHYAHGCCVERLLA